MLVKNHNNVVPHNSDYIHKNHLPKILSRTTIPMPVTRKVINPDGKKEL